MKDTIALALIFLDIHLDQGDRRISMVTSSSDSVQASATKLLNQFDKLLGNGAGHVEQIWNWWIWPDYQIQ